MKMRTKTKEEKGKGLLFNVVFDHSRRVLNVQFLQRLATKRVARTMSSWISYRKRQSIKLPFAFKRDYLTMRLLEICSTYVIADGGYKSSPTIICYPNPAELHRAKYKFADWVASVRKDVECFSASLNSAFAFFEMQTFSTYCNNVFVSCCILHNLILMHDGLQDLWEVDVNWKTLDPPSAAEELVEAHNDFLSEIDVTPRVGARTNPQASVVALEDNSNRLSISYIKDLINVDAVHHSNETRQQFEVLRDLLANHLQYTYLQRKLKWPKSRMKIDSIYNVVVRQNFPYGEDLT